MTANIQISQKANDGRIVVIGADNADDFLKNVADLLGNEYIDPIVQQFTELLGDPMSNAIGALQDANMLAPATSEPTGQSPYRAPASAPPADIPQCAHGNRKYVAKPAQNGKKAWAAWMCGGTQEQQAISKCAPIWE